MKLSKACSSWNTDEVLRSQDRVWGDYKSWDPPLPELSQLAGRQVGAGTEMDVINSHWERLQWEEGGCSSCHLCLLGRFVVECVPHRPAISTLSVAILVW